MNIQDYIQQTYDFLQTHDLIDVVLHYRELHPFLLDDQLVKDGVINSAFRWERTDEGINYWVNIHQSLPTHLRENVSITCDEFFATLRDIHTPKPYEFW